MPEQQGAFYIIPVIYTRYQICIREPKIEASYLPHTVTSSCLSQSPYRRAGLTLKAGPTDLSPSPSPNPNPSGGLRSGGSSHAGSAACSGVFLEKENRRPKKPVLTYQTSGRHEIRCSPVLQIGRVVQQGADR